jgi:serine/threonine-protein kinase RsbW
MAAATLELSFPARPEYLVLGRLALAGIARVRPLDADDLSDLKLALTEACSNSVRHAYGEELGSVDIRFEVDDGYLAIEVTDDGPGFDERLLDAEVGPPEALDEGGLGLSIIQAVCDEVELGTRRDGTGSCIRFLKRLA